MGKLKFVNAGDADFLRDKNRVRGIFRHDIAKAYPTRILDHHEIVNDYFGDKAKVVSFCPLCNIGITVSTRIEGGDRR